MRSVLTVGSAPHGQSDFHLNYIDPVTHSVRNYYPALLILTKDGEWLVVEVKAKNIMDAPDMRAKQEIAETMLKASQIKYNMIPHSEAGDWRQPPEGAKKGTPIRLHGHA